MGVETFTELQTCDFLALSDLEQLDYLVGAANAHLPEMSPDWVTDQITTALADGEISEEQAQSLRLSIQPAIEEYSHARTAVVLYQLIYAFGDFPTTKTRIPDPHDYISDVTTATPDPQFAEQMATVRAIGDFLTLRQPRGLGYHPKVGVALSDQAEELHAQGLMVKADYEILHTATTGCLHTTTEAQSHNREETRLEVFRRLRDLTNLSDDQLNDPGHNPLNDFFRYVDHLREFLVFDQKTIDHFLRLADTAVGKMAYSPIELMQIDPALYGTNEFVHDIHRSTAEAVKKDKSPLIEPTAISEIIHDGLVEDITQAQTIMDVRTVIEKAFDAFGLHMLTFVQAQNLYHRCIEYIAASATELASMHNRHLKAELRRILADLPDLENVSASGVV